MAKMMHKVLKIGINGFGRIGRLLTRLFAEHTNIQLVAINDVESDLRKLCYHYNHDSLYGPPRKAASINQDSSRLLINDHSVSVYSCQTISDVPWTDDSVDVVIDASGQFNNSEYLEKLLTSGINKVILTQSSSSRVDRYIVMGVNDEEYCPYTDKVISASICDVNAVVHPLKLLESEFGIKSGFITTLHPWLSYQRLLDGFLSAAILPSKLEQDSYSLGRSCTDSLIPKQTTLIDALVKILPKLDGVLQAMSYRVPTSIVASADITVQLRKSTNKNQLIDLLKGNIAGSKYLCWNEEPLVSIDYKGNSASAIYDARWIEVNNSGDLVKIVLWYDNEWGYCSRIVDMCQTILIRRKISKREKTNLLPLS
jgi:glyceraldehyde 3-phosphate dehydrogenase